MSVFERPKNGGFESDNRIAQRHGSTPHLLRLRTSCRPEFHNLGWKLLFRVLENIRLTDSRAATEKITDVCGKQCLHGTPVVVHAKAEPYGTSNIVDVLRLVGGVRNINVEATLRQLCDTSDAQNAPATAASKAAAVRNAAGAAGIEPKGKTLRSSARAVPATASDTSNAQSSTGCLHELSEIAIAEDDVFRDKCDRYFRRGDQVHSC